MSLVVCSLVFGANAFATHGNGNVAVDYVGSLNPSAPVSATLTNRYDWFCFAGTPSTTATVTVTRTSGTLLPNLELWAGVVANGTPSPYTGLVNDSATNTSNDLSSTVTGVYTLPASVSGKYSVVVSTWSGQTGDYSIALTGGTATSCVPAPVATKLAITAQPTPSVQVLTPFNVTVQTQDAASAATNVTAATTVTVAIQTGTGALTGTATCNIAIGDNSCTVTGIASNTVQTGLVLRATSSPVLTSADTTPFNVTAIPQAITAFAPTTPVVFGAAPATLTATGGASGSPIVFATTSLATVCTVSSPTVTFTGVGTCNLTANQAAAGNYSAAPQVTASIVINPAPQAITAFAPTTPVVFGAAPATLTATGGASGNPVVFATTSLPTICTVSGNVVTFVGIGTCNLTANQAAAGNYSAAPQVTASIVINPAPQAIVGFAPASPVVFGAAPATLTATGGASGSPIVFATTSLPTICTVSGSVVIFVGIGTCNLTANQAAASNYSAAPQVTASILISPAPQSITGFAPTTPVVFGTAPATLTATGGASGNPVVFATTRLATICTVSGNVVTFVGIGTCNLTANQAAAGNYSAAPQVTASIVISPAGATIIGFNPPSSAVVRDAPIVLSATGAPSGAPIIFATTSPASVCTVSGNIVTIVGPGLCVLTANQAASGNFAAAAQVTRNLAISITVPTLNAGLLIALAVLLVGMGAWTRRRV